MLRSLFAFSTAIVSVVFTKNEKGKEGKEGKGAFRVVSVEAHAAGQRAKGRCLDAAILRTCIEVACARGWERREGAFLGRGG